MKSQTAQRRISIFVSSPGDVSTERTVAFRVVHRLKDQYADEVQIDPYFWEYEPLPATELYQTSIPFTSTMDIVVCILWSRLGTPIKFPEPFNSGTEFEFVDAFRGYQRSGGVRPKMLVYHKLAPVPFGGKSEADVAEGIRQKQQLDEFVNRWFVDEERLPKGALWEFNTPREFEDTLSNHLGKMIEDQVRPHRKSIWHQGSPYRGLSAFDVPHAPIYFGREADVNRILGKLQEQLGVEPKFRRVFMLIVGRSGSGKSSLARAGVVARILKDPAQICTVKNCRYAIVRPGAFSGGDPFRALVEALSSDDAFPQVAAIPSLSRQFREDPSGAVRLVCQAMAPEPLPQINLVLVVDQLEEICQRNSLGLGREDDAIANEETLNAFVLAMSAFARSGMVCVVATLRSDFYDRFCRIPEFVSLKEGAGQYDLQPPTISEIGQMIRRPALAVSIRVDDLLENVLRDHVVNNRDSLPLLEFMLQQLYECAQRNKTDQFTMLDYESMGGMEGVISYKASETFAQLSEQAQQALPRVVRRLVNVADEAKNGVCTRRVCALSEFEGDAPGLEFIRAFADARLFTLDSESVEVTHEYLLSSWKQFAILLKSEEELLRLRTRVEEAADAWIIGGRRDDLLLPAGQRVKEGIQVLKANLLSRARSEFVLRSQRHRLRVRRVVQASLAIMGVLLVSFLGSIGYMRYVQAGLRITRLTNTRLLQDASLDRERLGDSGASAVLLGRALKEASGQNEILEDALRISVTLARGRILPLRQILRIPGEARGCAVGPEGKFAAVGAADGRVWLINLLQGQESATVLYRTGSDKKLDSVTDLAYDPNRNRFAVATLGGTIHIFELDGNPQPKYVRHQGQPFSVRFNAMGTRLLVAGRNGNRHPNPDFLAIYDIETGRMVRRFPVSFDLYAADFSADGQYVAAGGGDGAGMPPRPRLVVFHADDETVKRRDLPQPSRVFTVAFHPTDPHRLVTGDVNGNVRFWNLAQPSEAEEEGPEIHHEKQVRVTAFSADGRQILIGGEDGSARLWDVESRTPVSQRFDHGGQVRGGAIAQRLITTDYTDGVHLWDLTPRAAASRVLRHPSPVWDASFNERGDRVITGCASSLDRGKVVAGAARIWDVVNGGPPRELSQGADVMAARFRPGVEEAVTCGNDGSIVFWDTRTGAKLAAASVPNTRILYTAAFDDTGTRLACAGNGQEIRIFEGLRTGVLTEVVPLEKPVFSFVWDLRFHGNRLFADGGPLIRCWNSQGVLTHLVDMPDMPPPKAATTNAEEKKVEYFLGAIDGHGERVLIVDTAGHAFVWKVANPSPPAVPLGDPERNYGRLYADWHGMTDVIAIGGPDGLVKLWSLENGAWVSRHELQHPSAIEVVRFSPDGKWLVTGCRDGGVRLWSALSGVWTGAAWYHAGPITRLQFSRDGTRILSASRDGTARVVPFPDRTTGDPESLVGELEADAGIVMVETAGGSANVAAPQPITKTEFDSRRKLHAQNAHQ